MSSLNVFSNLSGGGGDGKEMDDSVDEDESYAEKTGNTSISIDLSSILDVLDCDSSDPDPNPPQVIVPRTLQLSNVVGLHAIPEQVVQQSSGKGYSFNLLCVGETGIGKSTLMNSLFFTDFGFKPTDHNNWVDGVSVEAKTFELMEQTVKLTLTVIESKGYGDQINKESTFSPIVKYVDDQFETYLKQEMKLDRCLWMYKDTRVHACLFVVSPTGHGLKAIDIECLKALNGKVNIIPLIGKADCISRSELLDCKQRILKDLEEHGITIYKAPIQDEKLHDNQTLNDALPFAIVASNDVVRVGSKEVRGRQYPWGIVQIENEIHCDFYKLREMLIRVNAEDLRDITNFSHYEKYRRIRMRDVGFLDNEVIHQWTAQFPCNSSQMKLKQAEEDLMIKFNICLNEKLKEFDDREESLQFKYSQCLELENQLKQQMKGLDQEIMDFKRMTVQYEREQKEFQDPEKPKGSGFGRKLSKMYLLGKNTTIKKEDLS